MRVCRSGAVLVLWVCLFSAVSFCHGNVVEIVGEGECADCEVNNVELSHAFSGLEVSIDCKATNGEIKTRGKGELDKEGKFKVSIPQDNNNLIKEECYAKLHSIASKAPCPPHHSLESSKIIFISKTNEKHTFSPAGKLKFSPTTCVSATFWPFFKHPDPFSKFHHLPKIFPPIHKGFGHHSFPFPPLPPKFKKPCPPKVDKPLPPPAPVYVKPEPPPTPVYKPPAPVPEKKPCPPPSPTYKKPNPPTYKPPTPVYKPKPPVYKPKPPVYEPKPPVYKPKPPVYEPKPPVYKPKPPVYKPKPPVHEPKPPVYKPKPPVYEPKPPVYKPPTPVYTPTPPSPVYEPNPPSFDPLHPFPKKPCPPISIPKLPPFPKIPPKYFHHPKIWKFPPLPPFPGIHH